MPLIELDHGASVRGVVLDETGQPVAGAKVEGKWTHITGRLGDQLVHGSDFGRSRSIPSLGDSSRCQRDARGQPGECPYRSAPAAGAGTNTPVKLVISGANTLALFGQVVDATGAPVAGVVVSIQATPLGERNVLSPHPVRFAGAEIRTDRDGRFRTPREIAAVPPIAPRSRWWTSPSCRIGPLGWRSKPTPGRSSPS